MRYLLLLALFLLTSCGSRKRALEKTKEQSETAIKTETETVIKTDVTKQSETITKVNEQAQEQEQEFTGEVADTSKPASVQTESKDGKMIQIFTNFKNVSNSSKTANKSNDYNNTTKQSEVDKSKSDLNQKEQIDIKTESKKKTVDVERKTGFPWWLIVLLTISAGSYLYFSKIKKSYNPLEWFKSLS